MELQKRGNGEWSIYKPFNGMKSKGVVSMHLSKDEFAELRRLIDATPSKATD